VSLRSLVLEIDPSNDPVSGWLSDEHGTRRSFSGWLGLAGALETLIDAPGERAADEPGEKP